MNQSGIFVPYGEFPEEQKFFTMKEIVVTHFLYIFDRCASMVSFKPSTHQLRGVARFLFLSSYLFMSYNLSLWNVAPDTETFYWFAPKKDFMIFLTFFNVWNCYLDESKVPFYREK